jgi:hypothetical protein
MDVLSVVIIRQFIQKLFGGETPTQIFQFTSSCSQINYRSQSILAMFQAQEEDRTRTSSAACSGSPVHLAAHLPRLDFRPGLPEQSTDGLVKHQYQFNENSLYTLIIQVQGKAVPLPEHHALQCMKRVRVNFHVFSASILIGGE